MTANKNRIICFMMTKTDLESFITPISVVQIDSYAFSKNKYLKVIILRKEVTTVGDCAMSECSSLEYAYHLNSSPSLVGQNLLEKSNL